MSSSRYTKTVEELQESAVKFWPSELSREEAELSIIPILLKTQDEFISLLSRKFDNLNDFFQAVNDASLPANLFLKHLVVLADFGGEPLKRLNKQFNSLFPRKILQYTWHGENCVYQFEALPVTGDLNNDKLGISGKKLLENQPLSQLYKDTIALILLGSNSKDLLLANNSEDEKLADFLEKCDISNYLGDTEKLNKFIKQRYICVSPINSGAKSNTLGQITQKFVKVYLDKHLNIKDVKIKQNTSLPRVRHTDEKDNRPTSFDIVVYKENKYVAIEVSFQVTTNSTIERKAGQAKSRYEQIKAAGYKIAYVLDGAGNFERKSALKTLCYYSHCTVAFTSSELDVLCDFLRNYFKDNS